MRKAVLALLLATSALIVAACAQTPAANRPVPKAGTYKLVRSGTLSVGTDSSFPPFETVQGTSVEGFDVDLAQAVARQLDVKSRFVNTPFDLLVPSLLNGDKFDVIISALPRTPGVTDKIDVSDPYLTVDQAVTMPVRSTLSSSTDLKGRTIGVLAGSVGQKWVADNAREASRVVAFDDRLAAFAALQAGNLDALVMDAPYTYYVLQDKSRGLRVVRTVRTGEEYVVGVRKDNPVLRDGVNIAIARIRASGEYDRIYKKWFPTPPP